MSIVRCPSCSRALNLPDASDVASAKCPLCGHVFDVGSRAPSAPLASPTSQPSHFQIGSPVPQPLHEDDDPAVPILPAEDHRAVASAVGWMRAAGLLGATHLFFCSCCSIVFIRNVSREETFLCLYACGYLIQGAVSLIVYNAGRSLERRGSRGWVWTGGVLSLVMSALATLMATPAFLSLPAAFEADFRRHAAEDSIVLLVTLLFDVTLAVSFLVGGVKALLVMSRPAIWAGFDR